MSSFSDSNFVKKLADLNNSQQSIQTLSLWLIHHRKHAKTITEVWLRELQKAKPNRKLTYLYLANDVVQNSKKKGPEFSRAFYTVLIQAYEHVSKDADEKTKSSMGRLLNIWQERAVFHSDFIKDLQQILGLQPTVPSAGNKTSGKSSRPSGSKQRGITAASSDSSSSNNSSSKSSKPSSKQRGKHSVRSSTKAAEPVPAKKKKVESSLSLLEEIELEKTDEEREPPDAEDLVKALEELENSASSDAAVRERIAALPPEVSDVSLLDKVQDKQAANELSGKVEDACLMLAEYNRRLSSELDERKKVARMLRDFISTQKEQLSEAEDKLKEYKSKLNKVTSVRRELKSHIQNLPDLTLLPDVTGGLAPLPSAGDLFAIEKEFS